MRVNALLLILAAAVTVREEVNRTEASAGIIGPLVKGGKRRFQNAQVQPVKGGEAREDFNAQEAPTTETKQR